MKPALFPVLRFGLAVSALTLGASAALFTLNPAEDAFISAANPTASFGAGGGLSVSAPVTKGQFDSLLKFDLAAARASFDATFGAGLWTIQSITLKLTNNPPNSSIFNGFGVGPGGTNINLSGLFSLQWMQNDTWLPGTGTASSPGTGGITYATLPTFLSAGDETLGTYAYPAANTGSNPWTLGLTSGFLADATAGNKVSLLALPADNSVAYTFNSGDVGTAASRPLLTITADGVPEPGTTALLAGAGCIWLARRRRIVL